MIIRHKQEEKISNNNKKVRARLHMSKKSSIFAPDLCISIFYSYE